MKPRRIRVLFALLAILAWVNIGIDLDRLSAQGDPASEILQLINEFRASRGLSSFRYNSLLATAAQRHANWMAANVIYSHTGEGGSSPLSRAANVGFVGYVVENIVGGSSMSPRQGLIWWQNSPIHLNTLVSTRYPEAGVGFATNGSQNMYVLVVGRQSADNSFSPANTASTNLPEPLIITPIELSEPREDGAIVHEMQQGQAMWTIAAYYDVDLAHLYLINSLSEKDVLHPGDEVFVRLPDGQDPPPTPTPPLSVVVQSGESAWTIAGRHSISVDYLFLLNNLSPNTVLQPGDELVIRLAEGQAPPPTATPILMYTIQSGDSAWSIAAQYGLTVDELLTLNSLSTDSVLRPGSQLRVRFPTPTPPPTSTTVAAQETGELAAANPAEIPTNPEEPTLSSPEQESASLTPIPAITAPLQPPDSGQSSGNLVLFIGVVLTILVIGGIILYRRRSRVSL
jgi:LysM repeat protein